MTDSHGVPWDGRRIVAAPFSGDDGAADPGLVGALTALVAAGAAGQGAAEERLFALLPAARVLVPVVADPGGAAGAAAGGGARPDDAADGGRSGGSMATALLQGPDGTRAMPVFTGVAALAAWDPAARPVPMRMPDAARAALDEGCAVVPVDLGSPHAVVLRASQLWALALGEPWRPAHTDPVVRLAVAEAAQGIDGLVRAVAEDGSLHAPGTLRLVLTLRPGLPGAAVDGIVARMGERLAADPDVRRRIDDLAVVLHQAADPADAVPADVPAEPDEPPAVAT